MSTNGINVCEDAEMADCEGEKVVTMMDVLKEQEDFEEDANAVLGASDDKNCTYSKGYVKRQAIYACMTCCTNAKNDPSKWAGVCLACSLTCHENHELIELYTKRNFCCDCGNPNFNSHPCQFTPNKTDLNIENIYNQNFSGVYCICQRPYPDPESTTEGDMIQCIICEDWLHSNHLDAIVPSNEQYSEMICKACMDKNEFLHDYNDLVINKENMDVDILNSSSEAKSIANCNENSYIDKTEIENITNSISVDIVNEETENYDAVIEKVIDADESKEIQQSGTKSESAEEQDLIKKEQSYITTSESGTMPSESTLIKNNEKKTETEHQHDIQSSEIKTAGTTQETNNNAREKQSSLLKAELIPIVKTETGDNRSQEQVEEDLLLADPMDTDLDQKDISNIVTSNTIQSSIGLLDAKKSEEIEISESARAVQIEKTEDKEGLQKESSYGNVPIIDQSENEAVVEESVKVVTFEETESTATTEKSENISIITQSENMAQVEEPEGTLTTKQLEDAPTTQQPESEKAEHVSNTEHSNSIPTIELSKIASTSKQSDSEQSKNFVTNDKLDLCDKNANNEKEISLCENNTADEENNSLEKGNSADVLINENNTADTINNDIQKDDTEINSKCDIELDKTIETDILKRKHSSDGDIQNVELKKAKLEDRKCVRPKGMMKVHHGATFWPSNFRHKLCTCNECISMYKDLSVLFLIDPDDTVTAYERLGKEKTDGKPASQYEKGMAALSSLGRVQQINALTEYTKLKDKLLDFLKTFKDKKVIVKEEDIKAFFAGMKPVREPDGVYFCR